MSSVRPPLSERSLARTYDGGSYADPWTAVEDYRRVRRMAVASPELGSSALATRLKLPRSRIRPWLEGSVPDPVRAIERATAYGWLNAEYGDPE